MSNNLVLVKSAHYNGLTLDCYVESNNASDDFWATREQIGALLEYAEPEPSIKNIHHRNKERLDKFSTSIKVIRVEGERSVAREVTLYNFKGLLEICRFSNQPKANDVMDWLWNVADEIRRTGSFSLKKEDPALPSGVLDGAKFIFETAGIKDNQLTLALDKVYKSYTGRSALLAGEIQLEAPVKEQALTPSELAEVIGFGSRKKGGRNINMLLETLNFQRKIAGSWEPIERGLKYAVVLDTNKKHSDGTPVRQVKWNSSIIPVLKELLPF